MFKLKSLVSFPGTHFLWNLFPGIDDYPPPFAAKPPTAFDDLLPVIQPLDIDYLKECVPELAPKLKYVNCLYLKH